MSTTKIPMPQPLESRMRALSKTIRHEWSPGYRKGFKNCFDEIFFRAISFNMKLHGMTEQEATKEIETTLIMWFPE